MRNHQEIRVLARELSRVSRTGNVADAKRLITKGRITMPAFASFRNVRELVAITRALGLIPGVRYEFPAPNGARVVIKMPSRARKRRPVRSPVWS